MHTMEVLALLGLAVCLHLVVAIGFRRYLYGFLDRSRAEVSDGANAHSVPEPADGTLLPCPRCGTANVPEYGFCRTCAARLPASSPPDDE